MIAYSNQQWRTQHKVVSDFNVMINYINNFSTVRRTVRMTEAK